MDPLIQVTSSSTITVNVARPLPTPSYSRSCQSGTSRPGDFDLSEQCCAPARHCVAGGGVGHAEFRRPSTGMTEHSPEKLAGGSIFIGLFWGGSTVGACALPAVAANAAPTIAKSMSASFKGPQILRRMSHPSSTVGPGDSSPANDNRQTDTEKQALSRRRPGADAGDPGH